MQCDDHSTNNFDQISFQAFLYPMPTFIFCLLSGESWKTVCEENRRKKNNYIIVESHLYMQFHTYIKIFVIELKPIRIITQIHPFQHVISNTRD